MAFDYFVGALTCPACDKVSDPDGRTNMQTKLRAEADRSYLGVGAEVDVSADNLRRSDYVALREPAGGPVRLLQTWECPFCSTAGHWAEIAVEGGRIVRISSIHLDRRAAAAAHYVAEEDAPALRELSR